MGVGGQRQEESRKEEPSASASIGAWAGDVSLGQVVSVILGQVLWKVRVMWGVSSPYLEFLQKKRHSRKEAFVSGEPH